MNDRFRSSHTRDGRWPLVVALAMALIWFMSMSQAQEPQYGGTLTIGYHIQLADGLDVMATTNVRDDVAQMVFEPLMTFDENFEPSPILAASWHTSDDELTWTFELRQGVTFHDGTPMTAADVEASFTRFMNMGQRRGEFARVEAWRAVDDDTFEITVTEPWVALGESLSMPSAAFVGMPTRVAEAYADARLPIEAIEDNIGTGPYRLASVDRERRYEFERF